MKKIFALALLLVLTLGIFVACSSVPTTEKKVRWNTTESWTYDISLCDFTSSTSTTNGTYYRDFLYSGELNPLGGQLDRIAPTSISGTYIVNLTQFTESTETEKKEKTKITTSQTIYATYEKDVIDMDKLECYIDSQTDTHYTLKSTTDTEVVFSTGVAQTPISSSTTSNGFYVGKQYQGVSKYSVQTTYTVEGKSTTATTTIDGGEPITTKISGTNVIDNNQVLIYIRSFDKTNSGFQDSPNVMVFDPLTQTTKKMSFVYNASQRFLLEHTFDGATESAQVPTIVNRLDVLMDGMSFMTQVNLPDLTEKGLDRIGTDVMGEYIPQHTILRFRVGFVSYQLTGYVTDSIATAIRETAE